VTVRIPNGMKIVDFWKDGELWVKTVPCESGEEDENTRLMRIYGCHNCQLNGGCSEHTS
jgi:hypothetical protein